MEENLTNKFIDIEVYEKATGELVLTQRCPSSSAARFLSEWIYRGLDNRYRATITNKEIRSSNISSSDFLNVPKLIDYNYPAN